MPKPLFAARCAAITCFVFIQSSIFYANAQSCSNQPIMTKYWQYRKNLKHFVAVDRNPQNGCINDGIGQDSNDPCKCSKKGYSLPGTSINQEQDGSKLMGDRNKDVPGNIWHDQDCEDDDGDPETAGTHWLDQGVHNGLDMGSETPHQLGWYWVVLATEYRLLKDKVYAVLNTAMVVTMVVIKRILIHLVMAIQFANLFQELMGFQVFLFVKMPHNR